ncbi:TadE/TadG family type IV pilus assembly protein [Aquisediminimonas profunda]|uniref:TadE/TadG family type IV pilus assembly protein n=1 Tax=Aquisediminimonas profunda TaxID=1550733 RepID=UPI001FEC0D77|nr:TadE/TadG family type IV pilus assembly protein [Aquisediminimonas profunda]
MKSILKSRTGGSAAEFTLVLPVLLLFLLGIVDACRLIWTVNQAEKATQAGVRYAVVTAPVASSLTSFSFLNWGGTLTQGDPIPANYGTMTCTRTGAADPVCQWTGTAAWATTPVSPQAFTNITLRMAYMLPSLTGDNVVITYSPTDLGFAGDPNGADAAPLVTVSLRNVTFKPLVLQLFRGAASIPLPDFRASLTLEDAAGSESN